MKSQSGIEKIAAGQQDLCRVNGLPKYVRLSIWTARLICTTWYYIQKAPNHVARYLLLIQTPASGLIKSRLFMFMLFISYPVRLNFRATHLKTQVIKSLYDQTKRRREVKIKAMPSHPERRVSVLYFVLGVVCDKG
jgi:hypothetical protein